MTDAVTLVVALLLLVGGAELLVRSASLVADGLGVPRLIIGLTVVAFGTSAPEFAVTTWAALDGSRDVAVGNVVGSNIFNVLAIIGVAALVAPVAVSAKLLRIDIPLMVGASLLLMLLALDGGVGRLDGWLLLGGFASYLAVQLRGARQAPRANPAASRSDVGMLMLVRHAAYILLGLALLVLGARLLVVSATDLARAAGLSELVIGLTIVAAGTSAPELATTLLATIRGERDIAVGNVVGSNLFNILAVLGVAAAAAGNLPVAASTVRVDLVVMLLAAAVCLPLAFTQRAIVRLEGVALVIAYVAYVVYLVIVAEPI